METIHSHSIVPWGFALVAALVCGPAWVQETDGEDTNPIELSLYRGAPPDFVGGSPIEIVVTVTSAGQGTVTAMGLYETLPQGWAFAGLRAVSGPEPSVAPQPGATGVLEFAWINAVEFPATISFAYTVNIPPGDAGLRILSGQIEYRMEAGRLVSPPVFTEFRGTDNTPPSLELLGPNPLVLEQGIPYEEPGYQATDDVDGDVTGRVRVFGVVNTNQPGEYVLRYTVADSTGNQSEPITRTVQVLASAKPAGQDTGGTQNTPAAATGTGSTVVPRNLGRVYGDSDGYEGTQATARQQPGRYAADGSRPASTQQERIDQARAAAAAKQKLSSPTPGGTPANPTVESAQRLLNKLSAPARPITPPAGAAQEQKGEKDQQAKATEAPGEAVPAATSTPTASHDEPADAAVRDETGDSLRLAANVAGTTRAPSLDTPPAPQHGFFGTLAAAFADMSRVDVLILAAVLLAATLLLALACAGWKSAYGGIPRRKRPGSATRENE